MIDPIPVFLKKVWDKWNIRVIVLVSLFLQTVLILAAPLRKRTSKKLLTVLMRSFIWSSYLLADWAANFAIGRISNGQKNSGCSGPKQNREIIIIIIIIIIKGKTILEATLTSRVPPTPQVPTTQFFF